MKIKKQNTFCMLLGLFVAIFDQASKFAVLAFINKGAVINVCPCFNLVLTFNFGTSFGLLNPQTILDYYIIVCLTIVCIIAIAYMSFHVRNFTEKILCSFIMGGAIGNLCDRFIHGAVVDFLDIYYNGWHWPAFNVADSFISVSALLLIIYNLFVGRGSKS